MDAIGVYREHTGHDVFQIERSSGKGNCHVYLLDESTQGDVTVNLIWSFSHSGCGIVLKWMPLDITNDRSKLVKVMAWCRQATSHYLSQGWPGADLCRHMSWLNYDEFINCFKCVVLSFVRLLIANVNPYTNFSKWCMSHRFNPLGPGDAYMC